MEPDKEAEVGRDTERKGERMHIHSYLGLAVRQNNLSFVGNEVKHISVVLCCINRRGSEKQMSWVNKFRDLIRDKMK